MNIDIFIEDIYEELVSYRRYFHMHPELSKNEYNTQKKIIEVLESYGIRYEKAATTGVVAFIEGLSGGKTVALRADIDALPIQEKNKCDYASINDGVMHACGHDVHTTILLGVAIYLQTMNKLFKGSVKLIFQPDEEVSGGAKDIVKEGFMKDVDYIIGLHVMPYIEVGSIEIKYGKLNASSTSITIDVFGVNSHGAYPESGVDAIMVTASILRNLQSIFTRETSPLSENVLSFGKIEGGIQGNIIADHVQVTGTLRNTNLESRDRILKRISEISINTAKMYKASANVRISKGYPALINNKFIIDNIIEVASSKKNNVNIVYKKRPSMGVEDFGYYQEKTEGAFFHLGCKSKNSDKILQLHSCNFDVDEECIKYGVKLQILNVFKLLSMNMIK